LIGYNLVPNPDWPDISGFEKIQREQIAPRVTSSNPSALLAKPVSAAGCSFQAAHYTESDVQPPASFHEAALTSGFMQKPTVKDNYHE
jgi:hypothetical protein